MSLRVRDNPDKPGVAPGCATASRLSSVLAASRDLRQTSTLRAERSVFATDDDTVATGVLPVAPTPPPAVVPRGPAPMTPLPNERGGVVPARGGGGFVAPDEAGLLKLAGIEDENADRPYGVVQFAGGDYNGYMKDGIPDGIGSYESSPNVIGTIIRYDGSWRGGKYNGVGTATESRDVEDNNRLLYELRSYLEDRLLPFDYDDIFQTQPGRSTELTVADGTWEDNVFTSGKYSHKNEYKDNVEVVSKLDTRKRHNVYVATYDVSEASVSINERGFKEVDSISEYFDESMVDGLHSSYTYTKVIGRTVTSRGFPTLVGELPSDSLLRIGKNAAYDGFFGYKNNPIKSQHIEFHEHTTDMRGEIMDRKFHVDVLENGVRKISNIVHNGVQGQFLSIGTLVDNYVPVQFGLDDWKVEIRDGGVIMLHSVWYKESRLVKNHPYVQNMLDTSHTSARDIQAKRDAEHARDEEDAREEWNLKIWLIVWLISTSTSITLNILTPAYERLREKLKESTEMTKTMIEKQRGYAGLDVNELLPDPPRPPASRPSASPARRRRQRTGRSSSMVDAVIDEFMKAKCT